MGSHSMHMTLPGKLTPAEVFSKFSDIQKEDATENGNRYDNGSWAAMGRLVVKPDKFPNAETAIKAILDRTSKAESQAVLTVRKRTEVVKRPTFSIARYVPAYPQIWIWGLKGHELAAELAPTKQGERLLKMLQAEREAFTIDQRNMHLLRSELAAVNDVTGREPDWATLKKVRRAAVTAAAKHATLKAKREAFEATLVPKVWKFKDLPDEAIWVIAGWAAS